MAADEALASYNSAVSTEIYVGARTAGPALDIDAAYEPSNNYANGDADREEGEEDSDLLAADGRHDVALSSKPAFHRKPSIVAVSTTISTQTEAISSNQSPDLNEVSEDSRSLLDRLGPPPVQRALLLIAEMSSEGNFITPEYTAANVKIARRHRQFVMGFIAQRSINSEVHDNFITMTPGVSLPPANAERQQRTGDGLGQQYSDPRNAVLRCGSDVVIVGRGILSAANRAAEAQRYQDIAWKAYEERLTT